MAEPYRIPDDKELFYRIQAGERAAFDIFYQRHFSGLYKAAFTRIQDTELCKDIIQEVFTDLWTRKAQIDNQNPAAYLYTAVRYQVFKYLSRHTGYAFYQPFEAMSETASVADALQYKELVRLIDLWIDTLPPKRREIFLLHYKENLSTRMIAKRLHISQKTVQNQLGIAFHSLRDRLPDMTILLLLIAFT